MIQVHVKLMGLLRENSPPTPTLDLPDDCTLEGLLKALGINPTTVHVFTVNGQLIRRSDHILHDADQVTVLPPVGGG